MAYEPRHMKWWGWGNEEAAFNAGARRSFWPFAKTVLDVDGDDLSAREWKLDGMDLPEARSNERFLLKLRSFLEPNQISDDAKERVIHAYGKGFRDLFRLRHGFAEGAPDLVVYPESERDVVLTLRAAADCDVMVIPFGGGSNISGCLERMETRRMAVSLDMRRMRKVLEVDLQSCTARIEAGVFGPDMEEQLNAKGVTLGHFPDSFMHSTLGGWIATRSAGMQSDKYGKIEDMVIAVRMVTPEGVLATRVVPKSAAGIDVKQFSIGSEGTLGIITEATMQVHLRPELRVVPSFLFPEFEGGIEAIHECVRQECMPSMVRFSDPDKTALSLAFRPPATAVSEAISRMFKSYLRVKGFNLPHACLMLAAFEGTEREVSRHLRQVQAIYRKFGAVGLGAKAGKSFESTKYDFPYIRDFLMDRDVTTDVSETSTVWSNILPLYRDTIAVIRKSIAEDGTRPWAGCHISHTYQTGASLYFTFGFKQKPGCEMPQYLRVKRAAQQSFIDCGATVSHHHAVGTEHLPWLTEDISPLGVRAVAAIKHGLDPGNVMNPGRLQPSANPFEDWVRITEKQTAGDRQAQTV